MPKEYFPSPPTAQLSFLPREAGSLEPEGRKAGKRAEGRERWREEGRREEGRREEREEGKDGGREGGREERGREEETDMILLYHTPSV